MKISLIVAAYNIEQYIHRCITSLINQTFENLEIIIVNDGSTDNTLRIIEELKKNNKNIKVINQENKGLIETRKTGFENATGEYILFVDGDDWLEREAVEILYTNAVKENADIVLFNAFNSYDDGTRTNFNTVNMNAIDEIKKDTLKALFLDNVLPVVWAKFIKRAFIIENNIQFPKNISYGEDLAFSAKLFMNTPNVVIVEDKLYNYYQRLDSISRSTDNRILEVNIALSYIENDLKQRKIYSLYEKEFEKLVYRHLMLSKILRIEGNYPSKLAVYKQYKNRAININNNKYIVDELRHGNTNLRRRVKLYNENYYFGIIYDLVRKVIFKVKDEVR